MRFLRALFPLLLAAANCHAQPAQGDARVDCTTIVSDMERLACFDAAAGTPPSLVPRASGSVDTPTQAASSRTVSDVTELIRQNEAARRERDSLFLISRSEDRLPGQTRVMISAPALDAAPQPTYLAISCMSNISRLQLLTHRPPDRNRISIRLFIDERALSTARPWQVMEEGNVIDAGRGLVAIDLLRQFSSGGRLRVESDYAPINGLMFNAEGLHALIAQQREACHW